MFTYTPQPAALSRAASATVCLIIAAALGCDSHPRTTMQRVGVSGKVSLDGRPLKEGAIIFHGLDHVEDNRAVTAFGFVTDGRYEIETEFGPVAGRSRVEFRAKPLSREALEASLDGAARGRPPQTTACPIPEKYGDHSPLTVDLTAEQDNHHDFDLESGS